MGIRRVYMMPTLSQAQRDTTNSINQCVIRISKYLTMYGWKVTDNPADADIIAAHAGAAHDGYPADVTHCHGLYPTDEFPGTGWHFTANRNVIGNLKEAGTITAPSTWVADIIRRDMNRPVNVIPWAIERSEWKPGGHDGYTLWNKTRKSAVCDPAPLDYLAQAIPDAQFVTTFTDLPAPPDNMRVTGRVPFDEMQDIIHNAALYLATTKETFGIGTLEAMACKVPILGYRWGGTADIVEHGVTGYLVEPGDLDGLVDGWRWCMRHRQRLAENARQRATENNYTWERVARQFAAVYDRAYERKQQQHARRQACRVSVVIPVHNYANYLPYAVACAMEQETDFPFEVLVIDDASTDDTPDVIQRLIEKYGYEHDGGRVQFRTLRNAENLGVAGTRNRGIRQATGDYIVCLDADDGFSSPHFLQRLADYLDDNPAVGCAYTGLGMMTDDPGVLKRSAWPGAFDAKAQCNGKNQVPTCNMFRRAAWESAGGYKQYMQPAEDAGLWLAMSMTGWDIKRVTDEPMFAYRWHDASLSSAVRRMEAPEPDWRLPYRGACKNGAMPFAAVYPTDKNSHPVRNYDPPEVSVIIPVGRGHERDVVRAVDSVAGQTDWRWECIVVNDSGANLTLPEWVREIRYKDTGRGAGAARNVGLAKATAPFVVFLDADDCLKPEFISRCLTHYQATGRYIYTDWIEERAGEFKTHHADPYEQATIFQRQSLHAVTTLIPTAWAREVGGFDENLAAWEDTDFYLKLAAAGYCGARLADPLFVYNYDSGSRREAAVADPALNRRLKNTLKNRYAEYRENPKMACGCNKPPTAQIDPAHNNDEMIRVMMTEGGTAPATLRGLATGTYYQRRKRGDVFFMYAEDVKAQPNKFQVLNAPPPPRPAPDTPDAPPTLRPEVPA